jgi:thiamine monophosphate kinase
LATIDEKALNLMQEAFAKEGLQLFPVGRVEEGGVIRIRKSDGSIESINRGGWDHFHT